MSYIAAFRTGESENCPFGTGDGSPGRTGGLPDMQVSDIVTVLLRFIVSDKCLLAWFALHTYCLHGIAGNHMLSTVSRHMHSHLSILQQKLKIITVNMQSEK